MSKYVDPKEKYMPSEQYDKDQLFERGWFVFKVKKNNNFFLKVTMILRNVYNFLWLTPAKVL